MKLLYKYILAALFLISIFILIYDIYHYRVQIVKPRIIHWRPPINTIACYVSVKNDALQSVEDPSFSPKEKSIFFHETSCRRGIDSRQACAVESAARAHPDWEVYLLFNSPVSKVMLKKSCLVKLLQYHNVKIARIHAGSFAKNTIVHPIVVKELWKSMHPIEHSADIMRMLTLNKWGGVYLDLDMMVVKAFDSLPQNWIAKETGDEISSGVMSFWRNEVGRNVTSEVLKEIFETYDPNSWSGSGSVAIQNVLYRRCRDIVKNNGFCEGVSIFGFENFYPVHYSHAFSMFTNKSQVHIELQDTYTYHLWNLMTHIYTVSKGSPYARLAREYCPKIYRMYGKHFGL